MIISCWIEKDRINLTAQLLSKSSDIELSGWIKWNYGATKMYQ